MSDFSQQPKRKRGRPRKYPIQVPETYEPPMSDIKEVDEEPTEPMIPDPQPQPLPMRYVPYQPEVITHLNMSGLDLSDIAKKTVEQPPPAPQPTNTPYNEPADIPMRSYEPMSSLQYSSYPPMPSIVPQLSAEEAKNRKDILCKIKRYQQSFEVLKGIHIDESASADELQMKLDDFRNVVSTKNTHTIVKTVYVTGVKAEIGRASCRERV